MTQRAMMQGMGISASAAVCAALAFGAAGCGSLSTTVTSQPRHAPAAPIERLLVLADMKGAAFNAGMYRAYTAGLANRLRLCGLRLRVVHRDPLDIDAEAHLLATLQAFRPSAVMSVKVTGGQLLQANGGLAGATVHSDLELSDVASRTVLWRAQSTLTYQNGYADRDRSDWTRGVSLATGVVARLRDDGLLPHCAVVGAEWPDVDPCVEQRRRAIEEGPLRPDETPELRGLDPAPMCIPGGGR